MVNVGIQIIVYIFQSNLFHCLNTNIYSSLETSGGLSTDLYLNVVHFFNTSVRHLLQFNTVVFLHWCLMHAVLLIKQSPIYKSDIKFWVTIYGTEIFRMPISPMVVICRQQFCRQYFCRKDKLSLVLVFVDLVASHNVACT